MKIIKTIKSLHENIKKIQKKNKTIGLVPTMGNLHNGHIQLILLAKKHVDIIIVSIFINPMQFDNVLDLENYPKTIQKDYITLKKYQVDIIFCPNTEEMYPNGIKHQTFVMVPNFSNILEGQVRPGHFKGMTTIISKLFNLIQPNVSFFGEKDYQQLLIIKILVKELNYNIKIISMPTIRHKNGLALSSRNNYLSSTEMKIAPYLYKIITHTAKKILNKDAHLRKDIIYSSKIYLIKKGFSINLFDIYDYKTLKNPSQKSKKVILLASVRLGKTHLIDNKLILLKQ